ncbi:MAG: hypothetical protein KatS3mg060_3572 [Dehalococcoidia bacterium]|nr:MAG: hypothetical protein KatS3mg060_3572 [Dehalococcoidia bacterium]
MPEVAEAASNVWYDTAASPLLYRPDLYRRLVDLAGVDRVLFASDAPLIGLRRPLEHFAAAALNPAERVCSRWRESREAARREGVTLVGPSRTRLDPRLRWHPRCRTTCASTCWAFNAPSPRGAGPAVKWVDPATMHLTLEFLGDVPRWVLEDVPPALGEALAGAPKVTLSTTGVGAFPNWRKPNVIWVGLDGDIKGLRTLRNRVAAALRDFGFAADPRPYQPHVTIGRLRPKADRALVEKLVSAAPNVHTRRQRGSPSNAWCSTEAFSCLTVRNISSCRAGRSPDMPLLGHFSNGGPVLG